jgi:NO-binding membrane sensor protein with MHYT domain
MSTTTIRDGTVLEVSWNTTMLFVSFSVAFLGGYVAVSLADQFRIAYTLRAKFLSQNYFLISIAICIGGVAIWCMHFVGMGSMQLKTPDGQNIKMFIDPFVTIMSLICAVLFSYIGLQFAAKDRHYTKDRQEIFKMLISNADNLTMRQAKSQLALWKMALFKGFDNILIGGVITALGVCVMHYVGMRAFSCEAEIEWNWGIVFASILIALVAAIAAFWILFCALPLKPEMEILRFAAAVTAAVAVCGMHYTGMAAATYRFKADVPVVVVSHVDMMTAAWGALAAAMGFLWIMTIFLLTDLRSWHLTLASSVSKMDSILSDLNTDKITKAQAMNMYCHFREKQSSNENRSEVTKTFQETATTNKYASVHPQSEESKQRLSSDGTMTFPSGENSTNLKKLNPIPDEENSIVAL